MNTTDETLHKAQAALNRQADDLDEFTVAKLRAARLRALDAAKRPARATWWLPASAATAAVVVAVTVAFFAWRTPDPVNVVAATDDAELLLTKDNPDMFNEQLEFYSWLSDDDGDAS